MTRCHCAACVTTPHHIQPWIHYLSSLSQSLRFLFNPFLFPPDLNKKLSPPPCSAPPATFPSPCTTRERRLCSTRYSLASLFFQNPESRIPIQEISNSGTKDFCGRSRGSISSLPKLPKYAPLSFPPLPQPVSGWNLSQD